MPADLKPVLARQMEIYAGFLEQTDHHVGRAGRRHRRPRGPRRHADLLHHRRQRRLGRGHEQRLLQRDDHAQRHAGHRDDGVPAVKIDDFGTPKAYNHYAVGWAHALCTPYQWTKQVASHWGGTRNGTIVHWPNGIKDKGEIRSQFHHVIDVAPTILEAAGLPAPMSVNGIAQAPLEGVSMMRDASTTRRRPRPTDVQYFEMFGNRGIYHEGWTAVTKHRTPWKAERRRRSTTTSGSSTTPDDWTQANEPGRRNPEKLAELQRLWLIEAAKYNVVPLDDRGFERINPDIAGPAAADPRQTQMLFPGMRVSENCVLTLKNKSHSVTAELVVPESGAEGVIITQGGSVGGWSLYAHEGKPEVLLQLLRHRALLHRRRQAHSRRQAPGADGVQVRRRRPGQGRRRHAVLRRQGRSARAASSRPSRWAFSADEACDVGSDTGSPASPDYGPTGNKFTGEIDWVQLDIGEDGQDRLIKTEDLFNIAMSRQ